mmetsp:Transcript_19064/g.59961  ORF Transcript_19064/g.59961 Transcript_19064/m.59961 type:complete len:148 (-) Transcript_19064:175-618(-)
MARALLALALIPVASAVTGALGGKGGVEARLSEEMRAWESEGSALNAAGYATFLEASARGATQRASQAFHKHVTERVEAERAVEIPMSDHFAGAVEERAEFPTLRELARSQWEGMKPSLPASKPAATMQQKPSSLRNLLMNAGRPGA